MRNLRTLILVVIAVAQSLPARAAVQARLDVAPAEVLPGLPAMFTLTLSNREATAQSVLAFIRLNATPATGSRFVVLWGGVEEETRIAGADDTIVLRPGESREFHFAPGASLDLNGAFWDARLTQPGTYDLQAEVGENFATPTNTVRLVVQQPAGADLAAWNAMQEITGGKGWPAGRWMSGASFLDAYPASQYAAAATFHRRQQLRTALPAALATLSGPLRDDLRMLLIFRLQSEADNAFRDGQPITGAARLAEALVQADQLKRTAATGYATARADEFSAQIRAAIAIRTDPHGKPYQEVTPLAPCQTENGQLMFGYENKNKWPIVMRPGPENRFDPAPIDRGQPAVFESGKNKRAFTASILAAEVVTWTLDGTTLTYRPDTLKKCGGNDDEDDDH